jgi:hypothetical protein
MLVFIISLTSNLYEKGHIISKGARSLAWLERPAHNRVVKGSNPFGPIIYLFMSWFIRFRPSSDLNIGSSQSETTL